MSIERMLQHPDWDWDFDNIYVRPGIPARKLAGALASYAPGVLPGEVIALVDDTVFGGAKEGLLVTERALYAKELFAEPRRIEVADVRQLEPGTKSRILVNGIEFFHASVVDHLSMLTFVSRLASVLDTTTATREPPPRTESANRIGLARNFDVLHGKAMQSLRHEMGEDEIGLCSLVDVQMHSVMRRLENWRSGVRAAVSVPLQERELDAQTAEFGLLVFMMLHYYAFSTLPEGFRRGMREELSFLYTPAEIYKDAFRAQFAGEFSVAPEMDEESMSMIPLMFYNRDSEFELKRPRAEVLQMIMDAMRQPRHVMTACVDEAVAAVNTWMMRLEELMREEPEDDTEWHDSDAKPESELYGRRGSTEPHEVLGIRPNASPNEIELAYRGRRAQYHPDRYAMEDEETVAWATARMQEVNEAYDLLKRDK